MPKPHLIFILVIGLISCVKNNKSAEKKQAHQPPELINTNSRPINKQWKGVWAFKDSTVFFTNDFEGGRLNGIINDSANHFSVLISAENYPINPSPWYAFKVWSRQPTTIQIQLTYQDSRNRYYPKVSRNGDDFEPLDSAKVIGFKGAGWDIKSVTESITFELNLSQTPTWVSAQELWTSSTVDAWMNQIDTLDEVERSTIGTSKEGRPIWMMEIGSKYKKKGLIIISRQHPPEVTGFLAMKSFIETIAGDSEQAQSFRKEYTVYNVPLMNPDGVDNGHWRHNMGGIDLNRDWQEFHQPETAAVRDFLAKKKSEGVRFVFGADFHSTWHDIYYPLDSSVVSKEALFIYDWIEQIANTLSVDHPNIKPSKHLSPTMVSRNFFYKTHNIPSIVFELGDNTKRDFLKRKGKIAAEELMTILLEKGN